VITGIKKYLKYNKLNILAYALMNEWLNNGDSECKVVLLDYILLQEQEMKISTGPEVQENWS